MMDWLRICFYANFTMVAFCYLDTDFIIYNDIFIRPISWSKDDFTIIHHNTRKVLLFAKLGVTLDQFFEAKIFFAGTEEQYLVLKLNNTVKIIDMYEASVSGSFTDPESKNFIYAPQTNSDRLWRFETLEYKEEKQEFTLIESVNINGEVNPPGATLSQTLYWGRNWQFVSMFEWKGNIYASFLMPRILTVLGVDPMTEGSETNLNKLIKAFLPRDIPQSMNLIPSSKPLINMMNDIGSFYSKDFGEILNSFPKLLETCSLDNKNFYDLEALISKGLPEKKDYCNKEKMPVFENELVTLAQCFHLKGLDYHISYRLSHGVDRDMLILLGNDKLLMCKFVECDIKASEFLKNCKIFNFTGGTPLQPSIDTRTANLVLPLKNDTGTFPHLFPIIVPDDLLNCPNCMILGYHHNFMWSQSLGCFKQESSNISDVDVCHPETEATRQLYGQDQVELTISYSYELQANFGEIAYVMIDNIQYNITSNIPNAYKAIVPNEEATNFEIHVYRATGGPMKTSFRIVPESSIQENYMALILLVLSVLVFSVIAALLAFTIFKRIQERRDFMKSVTDTTTTTTAASKVSSDLRASKISQADGPSPDEHIKMSRMNGPVANGPRTNDPVVNGPVRSGE